MRQSLQCFIQTAFVLLALCPCAWAQNCTAMGSTSTNVDIVVNETDPTYDFSHNDDQIASLGRDNVQGNQRALGLTKSYFRDKISGHFDTLQVPGGFCVRASEITLELGYAAIEVFVSSDYADGTCQKRVVLEHENIHVSNALKTFERYLPAFKYALDTTALQITEPIFVGDAHQGMESLLERYKQPVLTVSTQMSSERQGLDRALDSPESYASTARRCPAW